MTTGCYCTNTHTLGLYHGEVVQTNRSGDGPQADDGDTYLMFLYRQSQVVMIQTNNHTDVQFI